MTCYQPDKRCHYIDDCNGVECRAKPSTDWLHLKPYGYAPGYYMSRCHKCGAIPMMDKRAITCRPCAEVLHAESQHGSKEQPRADAEVAAEDGRPDAGSGGGTDGRHADHRDEHREGQAGTDGPAGGGLGDGVRLPAEGELREAAAGAVEDAPCHCNARSDIECEFCTRQRLWRT